MSVVLSEHLPLLATAPDGIQKLRGLILELAVRGKLVPQDPNDEPASELLKRIAKERIKLDADGKNKRSKPLPPVEEEEQPFTLPTGWSWGRIGDIANSQAGFAFKSSAFNDARIGLPLIRIRDVGLSNPSTYFDGPYRDEFVVTEGDYLVSMDGQFRVAEWKGPKALLNQRVSRLLFYSSELAQSFFAISLHMRLAELQGVKAYTTVDHLSGGQISAAVAGIPPLAEQHRIVAKVDELMALCDRLEAEQTDAEAAHVKLIETLLGTLPQSTDAADLAANWQRLAEHFDTLFTTESSLDALKQTILQLAVMGKLVPQDPKDEPASELLNRIAKERVRLEAEGIRKKSKPLPPVGEDELSFVAPRGWAWCRLQSAFDVRDGTHDSPKFLPKGIPFLTSKNIYGGKLDLADLKFISESDHLEFSKRSKVDRNDILFAMIGSIGNPVIVDTDLVFSFKNMALFKYFSRMLSSPQYLRIFLAVIASEMRAKAAGGVQSFVSLGTIRSQPIALPPLAEQHRIVAKVDELMALCDRLRADLAESCSRQARLSTTLIESALAAA